MERKDLLQGVGTNHSSKLIELNEPDVRRKRRTKWSDIIPLFLLFCLFIIGIFCFVRIAHAELKPRVWSSNDNPFDKKH